MTSTSANPVDFHQPPKDPTLAALLSLVLPGLGQIYNGESRKGTLFLGVSIVNFFIFLTFIFHQTLAKMLVSFGAACHMKPNYILIVSLLELSPTSTLGIILFGFILAFIAYAMRDAYDHAALLRRRQIYPEYVLEMSEATSISYLGHFTVLLVSFILALFFLISSKPQAQITDIEFIQNQTPTIKKIISQRKAEHASENAGKHEKKEIVAPSPAPKAPSKAQPKAPPQPVAKPTPQPTPTPKPTPSPRPTPQAHPTPAPAPSPHPTPAPTPSFKPTASPSPKPSPMPTPFAHPSANPSPNPSPSPSPMSRSGSSSPSPVPRPGAGPGAGSQFAPAPAPVSVGTGQAGGSPSPVPVPVGGGSTSRGGGGGPAPAPAPSRATSRTGGGGGGSPAIAPVIPRSAGGGGGEGIRGNPDANNNPNKAPSVAAQADVDFGPYMADLQRRIKRAWYPPKGNESKRVVVVFKIHRGGELSNLRLERSSTVAIADQAALKAVENAAPFRPLPAGAADDVDIQFTFDYNVFSGGGSGVFRRF